MSEIDSLIDSIIRLPIVAAKQVGSVVGIPLSLDRESPYARFYKGEGGGRLTDAMLQLDKDGPGWSIVLNFSLDDPYSRDEIALSRYGEIVNVQMIPEMPPEGATALTFNYGVFDIVFTFSSSTDRLVSLSVAK